MKKMMMTMAVMLTVVLHAFAADGTVDARVTEAFKKDFGSATEIQWTAGADYHKVSFYMNGQRIFAYYTTEGSLMGVTRNISPADLPLMLQTTLRKDYGNFWISELFEVAKEEGSSYYITVENADQKIILQSTDSNTWKSYKKNSKA